MIYHNPPTGVCGTCKRQWNILVVVTVGKLLLAPRPKSQGQGWFLGPRESCGYSSDHRVGFPARADSSRGRTQHYQPTALQEGNRECKYLGLLPHRLLSPARVSSWLNTAESLRMRGPGRRTALSSWADCIRMEDGPGTNQIFSRDKKYFQYINVYINIGKHKKMLGNH